MAEMDNEKQNFQTSQFVIISIYHIHPSVINSSSMICWLLIQILLLLIQILLPLNYFTVILH